MKQAVLSETSVSYGSSGSLTLQLARNHYCSDSVDKTQQELGETARVGQLTSGLHKSDTNTVAVGDCGQSAADW